MRHDVTLASSGDNRAKEKAISRSENEKKKKKLTSVAFFYFCCVYILFFFYRFYVLINKAKKSLSAVFYSSKVGSQ